MQLVYKTLNNIQTKLIIYGDPFDSRGSDVIICITGNTGIPDFYKDFASKLHENTGLPICVIGHAGHVEVSDSESNILNNKEHLFNLEGQLEHKLDLINNHIDKKSKLHFIGHSIGAWMVAELMMKDQHIIERVLSVNFICPTIQRIAETKHGKYVDRLLRRFHLLVIILYTLAHWLPESLKIFLVGLYLKYHSYPTHYTEGILIYLNPKVVEKVLFLGYDAMVRVAELNTEAINRIKHLTNIIYNNKDDWTPVEHMNNLKQFQPEMQIREANIDHPFVLKYSEIVAEMVSEFIKSKTYISLTYQKHESHVISTE